MKRLSVIALLMSTLPGWAADYTIMAPASPGGGWDQTARTMQAVMQKEGISGNVQVVNVPGAGGTIGLAQFVNQAKGSAEDLLVGGYVMVGAILNNQSAVDLSMVTPIARLTGEQEVVVVPASSDIKTMADLVAKLKADPGSVSWGGGSAGGTDHILAGLVAKAAGVDPTLVNYIAFSGGGEALAAILGGQVTAGVSGYGEFESQVKAGELRLLAVSGDERIEGVDAPTLKESGLDVSLENWRMVAAGPDLDDAQKAAISADIEKLATSEAWKQELATRGWDDRYPRRSGVREAARRRHRVDQGDPDRHRPGGMSTPGKERRPDRAALVIAALLALLAVVIWWQTGQMRVSKQHAAVGPKTAPYVMVGFLALLAVGHVVTAFRHGLPARDRDNPIPMLWIIGGLVLQMLLLKPAGFAIATGLLFACAARAFGRGPLWMTVPIGIAVSLVIWLIFAGLLNLSLPAGPLEHLFL